MPWKECSLMSSRLEFIRFATEPGANIRELCRRFGISPKTAYKWLARYQESGVDGLRDRSRRPHSSPKRTSAECEARLLALRTQYPYWGARKLAKLLLPGTEVPSPSTITAILSRHGLLDPADPEGERASQRFEYPQPNQLWQMDFKGHFPLTDRHAGRCYPLTILDDHSRFSLCLQACANQQAQTVRTALMHVFRCYGLPERILADNGAPWGMLGSPGISALEAWLIRLGVRLLHGRPYHPQTQGKEERFHRTLKRELLDRHGFSSLDSCQKAFDRWREQYNLLRPHEALDLQPPVHRYHPSGRPFPESVPAIEYDSSDEVRKVLPHGDIRFKQGRVFISQALAGEHVAIRPTADEQIWEVYYCHQRVRQINLSEIK